MHGEGRGVGEEEGHTERAVGGGRRNGWEEGEDRKRKKGEKEKTIFFCVCWGRGRMGIIIYS